MPQTISNSKDVHFSLLVPQSSSRNSRRIIGDLNHSIDASHHFQSRVEAMLLLVQRNSAACTLYTKAGSINNIVNLMLKTVQWMRTSVENPKETKEMEWEYFMKQPMAVSFLTFRIDLAERLTANNIDKALANKIPTLAITIQIRLWACAHPHSTQTNLQVNHFQFVKAQKAYAFQPYEGTEGKIWMNTKWKKAWQVYPINRSIY